MTDPTERHQQQIKREGRAEQDSVDRFRAGLQKGLGNSKPAFAMVEEFWQPLSERIKAEQDKIAASTVKVCKPWRFTLALAPDSLAVITLNIIIQSQRWSDVEIADVMEECEDDLMSDEPPGKGEDDTPDEGSFDQNGSDESAPEVEGPALTTVARQLARCCESHWLLTCGEEHREAGLARCVERYPLKIRKAEEKKTRRFLYDPWRTKNRDVHLGRALAKLAENARVIQIVMGRTRRHKRTHVVRFGKDFERAFLKFSRECKDFAAPIRRPMIEPPRRWTESIRGGYQTSHKNIDVPLVKPNIAAGDTKSILGTDWTIALEAIHALQETRWKINEEIYDQMRVVRSRYSEGMLPDLTEGQVSRLGLEQVSKQKPVRYVIDDKCDACEEIKTSPEIFFPYQFDYRGRIYPIPTGVNPQVDDVGRSLLTFADGKPMDKVGGRWLAVHLANSWGRDTTMKPKPDDLGKQSYRVRIKWVRINAGRIKKCAEDPLEELWWMKAAKPWRFLAACFEWRRYRSCRKNFNTHLPVTIDGTCNGLQHIAALRLDPKLALETNLTPGEHPNDIYLIVAKKVEAILEQERIGGNQYAAAWLDNVGIDRDVCKRAVMTTPYGVTWYGMLIQLFKAPFSAGLHVPGFGLFHVDHMKNYDRFEHRLRTRQEPVSEFIWSRLSESVQKILESLGETPDYRCSVVVEDLNRILQGPSLYSPDRFTKISDETIALLAKEPVGADVVRLNKLLILDSYRLEIKRTQGWRWSCCAYLATKLKENIGKLVDPEGKLKVWLDSVAEANAKKKRGISWISPSCFPICQKARVMKTHKVRGDQTLNLTAPTQKIDLQKQKSKIVPNFIHSLDAAHLMKTIASVKADTFSDFGVIHDGYAVHACHVEELQTVLRREFVKMHSRPLLDAFRSQQLLTTVASLDPAPETLGFKIDEVIASKYFFC